jgi:hypothetical protein
MEDLPSDAALRRAVKEAAALNEAGLKVTRAVRPKPPVRGASRHPLRLRKNTQAAAAFDAFPPSHKREYVEWITEAKAEPHGSAGSIRLWRGWRKASRAIGNTCGSRHSALAICRFGTVDAPLGPESEFAELNRRSV